MNDDCDWSVHLWDDEHIAWQGRPTQRTYIFSWIDLYLGLFVLGLIRFAAADPSTRRVQLPPEFDAYFVPLATLLIASAIVWKRLFSDKQIRSRQIYALTNKRALIYNLQSHAIERSSRLCPDLDVFVAGVAYRYVVFTGKRRIYWRLFRGIMLDGPPDLLGPNKNHDLHFLAIKEADMVVSVATSINGRTVP